MDHVNKQRMISYNMGETVATTPTGSFETPGVSDVRPRTVTLNLPSTKCYVTWSSRHATMKRCANSTTPSWPAARDTLSMIALATRFPNYSPSSIWELRHPGDTAQEADPFGQDCGAHGGHQTAKGLVRAPCEDKERGRWVSCIQTDQWMIEAQEGDIWYRGAKGGIEMLTAKWIATGGARTALRHVVLVRQWQEGLRRQCPIDAREFARHSSLATVRCESLPFRRRCQCHIAYLKRAMFLVSEGKPLVCPSLRVLLSLSLLEHKKALTCRYYWQHLLTL